jgi:hypothetical protein
MTMDMVQGHRNFYLYNRNFSKTEIYNSWRRVEIAIELWTGRAGGGVGVYYIISRCLLLYGGVPTAVCSDYCETLIYLLSNLGYKYPSGSHIELPHDHEVASSLFIDLSRFGLSEYPLWILRGP